MEGQSRLGTSPSFYVCSCRDPGSGRSKVGVSSLLCGALAVAAAFGEGPWAQGPRGPSGMGAGAGAGALGRALCTRAGPSPWLSLWPTQTPAVYTAGLPASLSPNGTSGSENQSDLIASAPGKPSSTEITSSANKIMRPEPHPSSPPGSSTMAS